MAMNARIPLSSAACLLALVAMTADAQIKLTGTKYVTAPLAGEQFYCYVANTSDTTNAVVANVEVYDGATGQVMAAAIQNFVPNCGRAITLLPHEACGMAYTAGEEHGSVGHCQFTAIGFVTGSLTARRYLQAGDIYTGFDYDWIFTTADAMPE